MRVPSVTEVLAIILFVVRVEEVGPVPSIYHLFPGGGVERPEDVPGWWQGGLLGVINMQWALDIGAAPLGVSRVCVHLALEGVLA